MLPFVCIYFIYSIFNGLSCAFDTLDSGKILNVEYRFNNIISEYDGAIVTYMQIEDYKFQFFVG